MRDRGAHIRRTAAGSVPTLRHVLVVALSVVAFGNAAPPASAQDTGAADQALAVVKAAGGSLREAGDGYRLVLRGIEPRAVWFSDRPARSVGSLTIDELTEAFFSGDDDPNAALEVFEGPGSDDVVVLELSNPRRRGSARLVLDARILTQDELADSVLRAHAERATSDVPTRFGAAAIYIDDATVCLFGNGGAGGNGGTDSGTGGDGGAGGIGDDGGISC